MESCLCHQAPYISKLFFISIMCLSWILKCSSVHRLQLGFVNVFIDTIRLSCFITLNVMNLHKSVRDVVYLKCCLKWAANKSDLFHLREDVGDRRNYCQFFIKCLLSVTYINSGTHEAFYLID